jgi:hypothetical protein
VYGVQRRKKKLRNSSYTHSLIHTLGGFLMVGMDGAEAKKERMEQIARKIQGALYVENPLMLSRIIAQIEYEFGLTKAKIQEYLEILENLGQFTIDEENNKITRPEQDVEGLGSA